MEASFFKIVRFDDSVRKNFIAEFFQVGENMIQEMGKISNAWRAHKSRIIKQINSKKSNESFNDDEILEVCSVTQYYIT